MAAAPGAESCGPASQRAQFYYPGSWAEARVLGGLDWDPITTDGLAVVAVRKAVPAGRWSISAACHAADGPVSVILMM